MVRRDAFGARLRTHKLKGDLSAYWAYSVNREYRCYFGFLVILKSSITMSAPMRSIAKSF